MGFGNGAAGDGAFVPSALYRIERSFVVMDLSTVLLRARAYVCLHLFGEAHHEYVPHT